METENRPNAALINKEWWESARKVLSYEEQGALLIEAVEYVLYGIGRTTQKGKVGIVFEMIKPALDSDVAKYRERCARNAANARSGRERAAASGSEWQRVAANTTPTPTTTTTTTTTTISSISNEERRDRERFEIYGYFWSVGSADPRAELDAFWDYYESLGWKNNKGAVIASKLAAARMWRRQFETKTPPDGAQQWYKAAKECAVPNPMVFYAFMGAERKDEKIIVHLSCSSKFCAQIRENTPRLEADLRAIWRGLEPVLEPAG